MVTLFKREVPLPESSGNRRIEERLLVNLPVEITWFGTDGNVLTEQTTIEDVTSIGCRFTTQVEFHRGDIISLRPLASGQKSPAKSEPQPFEVMWASKLGGRWTTGAKKLEGEKLASAKIPLANDPLPETSK
jgi:hypothetical protein